MRHFKRHHYTEYENLANKCVNQETHNRETQNDIMSKSTRENVLPLADELISYKEWEKNAKADGWGDSQSRHKNEDKTGEAASGGDIASDASIESDETSGSSSKSDETSGSSSESDRASGSSIESDEAGGSSSKSDKTGVISSDTSSDSDESNDIISQNDLGSDTTSQSDNGSCDGSINEIRCKKRHGKVKKDSIIKWDNKIISCTRSVIWYTKIKCIFCFVLKMMDMNRKQRKSYLKRLSDRRIMFVSDICSNLLNRNVGLEKKFVNKIRCYEQIITELASKKNSLRVKHKLLVTRDGIEMVNMILPKVSTHLQCVLINFFQG